jgi:hypothetical protein
LPIIKSLWPDDIGQSDLVTPVSIMREQAALLGEKTGNLVTAEVVTTSQSGLLTHSFSLDAPALSYRYLLFYARHQIALYPVDVTYQSTVRQCADEAQFRQRLGEILSSDATKQVVKALIAQSRG